MRDVAEIAGVALTTVSRAFSDPAKLSPDTLRRIASASADLGYTVNLNARALRSKTSGVVLVLLPDIGNPFFSLVLKGIEEAARQSGRVLLIGDTGADGALSESYAAEVEARTVDGMILLDGRLPYRPGSPLRARLLRAPLVALSERVADARIPYVGIDNVAAGRDVAAYLADLGHTAVAHIAGPSKSSLTAERRRGFVEGAEARGLDMIGCITGDFSVASGRAALSAMLGWPRRPSALFASNDEMAMGAIHAARAAGLSVPGDLSVVGFDDIGFSELHEPPLTTVRQPRRAMGRAALDLVVAQIEGRPLVERTITLDHRLIIRGSARPPPNRQTA